MEEFNQFIKEHFSDFTLKNITNALNSRNSSSWAATINKNPENIYFIEKKVKTVNIFRNMKYPDDKYILFNKDKSLAFKDKNNIEEFKAEIANFLEMSIEPKTDDKVEEIVD